MGVAATLPELSEWTLPNRASVHTKVRPTKVEHLWELQNYLSKFIASHL